MDLDSVLQRIRDDNQNSDGGWGGTRGTPSTIEETAVALEALVQTAPQAEESIERGETWLQKQTENGTLFEPAPIGFYFAKLWYYEKLYPLIFTVAACQRVALWLENKNSMPAVDPADEHS